MEDNKFQYDSTVRVGNYFIVDFTYGGDNLDPIRLEKLKLSCLTKSTKELEKVILFPKGHLYYQVSVEQLNILKESLRKIRAVRSSNFDGIDSTILLPVNLSRIIDKIHRRSEVGGVDCALAHECLQNCVSKCEEIGRVSVECLRVHMLTHLNATKLVKLGMSLVDVENICDIVINKYENALVSPGEAVGSVAAQSIGEPCTQVYSRKHSNFQTYVPSDLKRVRLVLLYR